MRPAETFTLPPACSELAARVEKALTAFLVEQRDLVAADDPGVRAAFDELERVIASGGKRLRPVFCCLGHLAAGSQVEEELIRTAAAIELLHTFALVHDDVMDRSAVRRGESTTWRHLAEEHRRFAFRGDAEGYGISAAVLVGDLAITLADRAFLESGFQPERLLPAFGRYGRMRTDMVAGQFLDVVAANRGEVGEGEARRIAVLKSGAYTVEGPLHIGAILAGANGRLLATLSSYGVALGEAFQLRDDILGAFGDPSVTGKDRDSDLREGKRTVLIAKAMAKAGPDDRRFLEERLGRPNLSDEEVERIRKIIEVSGALVGTEALVEELGSRARSSIDPELIPQDVRALLLELVDVLIARPV
ncbi:MAG TPA: polyprenyl synthetase family protein [Actinomycetota bacterium]|nr:polyprenyl synthetase family protein [Actinomycetota bacterium]